MITKNEKVYITFFNLDAMLQRRADLKSSDNFVNLSDELAGIEDRIETARRDYNEAVEKYDLEIITFPKNLIAGMFCFTMNDYFY